MFSFFPSSSHSQLNGLFFITFCIKNVCYFMQSVEKQMGMAGSEAAKRLLAVNCTHPRSASRVQMLEEELAMMQENKSEALDKVMHKIPYWML